ncbi:MAG: SOS response-associated peptidase family protein [Elusimicrobia bacterium]|nr:SOS response-associated peptidase family protein [Elusimicrobiota bacterium]
MHLICRMPVILRQKDEEKWLDPDLRDVSKLLPLLAPYSSKEMDAYEVSTIVNSPQNDDPQCIAPAKA